MRQDTRSTAAAHRQGFTLIELVVVIGVVLLLAGLTLSVSVAVIEQSERRQTETALQLLDAAVKEWEVQADRKLTWWDSSDDPAIYDRFDVHADTPEVLIISEMLGTITRPSQVKQIISQIDPALLYTYTSGDSPPWLNGQTVEDRFVGSLTVLDAWGKPIYATHPGRTYDPNTFPYDTNNPYGPDPDGTISTYNELLYGVAPNRQVVFVSAGPDGVFGLPEELGVAGAELSEAAQEARADNIYSLPVQFQDYDY